MLTSRGMGTVLPSPCDGRWVPGPPCPDGMLAWRNEFDCTVDCVSLVDWESLRKSVEGRPGVDIHTFNSFGSVEDNLLRMKVAGIPLPLLLVGGLLVASLLLGVPK